MEADKTIYYTDGHQVTITDTKLKVNNTLYQLDGITRHGFSIIHPRRISSNLLMVAGTFVFACGALDFIPASWSEWRFVIFGFSAWVNTVMMITGGFFFLIGLFILYKQRDKYAVKIFTAEGEKNVVISQSREYISQIVDALNRAFMNDTKRSGNPQKAIDN